MKKLLYISLLFFGCMLYASPSYGMVRVPLEIIDDSEIGDFGTKGPHNAILELYQDEDLLIFSNCDSDYILRLLDVYENIVYTVLVPAGTTHIVLPATLSGFFQIRLCANLYYYKGFISL